MSISRRRSVALPLLAALALVFTGTGCSMFKKARKAAAKAAGVKPPKTQTVELADLGEQYAPLKDTEWDAFSKTATEKPLKVTYKTFDVKSIDEFLAEANGLYAAYELADRMVDKTYKDLQQFIQGDIYVLEEKQLKAALKNQSADGIHQVERFKVLRSNLQIFITALGTMGQKAMTLKTAGEGLVDKAPKEFQKSENAKKALYADEAVLEAKSTVTRLISVGKGAPELVKKIIKLGDVVDWVMQEIANPGANKPAAAPAAGAAPSGGAAPAAGPKAAGPKPPGKGMMGGAPPPAK